VEAEKENRSKREAELRARIEERNAELRRLNVELESLLKVEAEQREALEKLGNNEPAGI
jgi:vacuolar-type H+-ATPase subunit I/STV1